MNHLAHFYLAAPQPGLIVGSVLGDYVKGRLAGQYTPDLELGIKLHRAIDACTDRHSVVRRSYRRFEPRFRRFAPLMTDIIFDHLLAIHWEEFHDESLGLFHDKIFGTLNDHQTHLPEAARQWSERMQRSGAMLAYDEPAFVRQSFSYLSSRLSRSNPLTEGFEQFERYKTQLTEDFYTFFPDLVRFVTAWKRDYVKDPSLS